MSKSFWKVLSDNEYEQIVVPIIQRDYAQGRYDDRASSIRYKFLNSLGEALADTNSGQLSLDFIYGAQAGKQIELIDGQQRFTTLFLLHWYLAGINKADEEVFDILKKFTYRARTSSKEFCKMLCENQSSLFESIDRLAANPLSTVLYKETWFLDAWKKDERILDILRKSDDLLQQQIKDGITGKTVKETGDSVSKSVKKELGEIKSICGENNISISKELYQLSKKIEENEKQIIDSWIISWEHPFTFVVRDAIWYLREWEYDPTVTSMLNMLDSIARHIDINKNTLDAWNNLTSDNSPIVFEFLPVNDFGNSEDLYVKMNSRGKPLTDFENFKALFGKHLEDLNMPKLAREYWSKIDGNWSATFWDFIKGRYKSRNIPGNDYYFSIDDTILKYIWLQVEMYSVAINATRSLQPDFYEAGKPKLVFEHIDDPKSRDTDWTNKYINKKAPEALLISSLEKAETILGLIEELLCSETGITCWNFTSAIDRLLILEKYDSESNKPIQINGTGSDDYMIRILAFVIIYWCSAFKAPESDEDIQCL